ncbi:TPA: HEPN domain-containing protein [Candidatus Bathyarchaeota archaeon]|nr:HEPN domain-containing protein [Candidatus Bathyarchaeota archaeon]
MAPVKNDETIRDLRRRAIEDAMEYLKDSEEFRERMKGALHRSDWKGACFNAHQCAQLAVKALLLGKLGRFKYVHLIDELLKDYKAKGGEVPENILSRARRLNVHYIAPRYFEMRRRVGIAYDERIAQEAVGIAEAILCFARRELRWTKK